MKNSPKEIFEGLNKIIKKIVFSKENCGVQEGNLQGN